MDLFGINLGYLDVQIFNLLLIWYASHQNRLAIEELIAGETFYGVPYRMQNR